jgi:hypothetical protein
MPGMAVEVRVFYRSPPAHKQVELGNQKPPSRSTRNQAVAEVSAIGILGKPASAL